MSEKEIFDIVASIASKHSVVNVQELSHETSINYDLRIDGDDIEDMISEIHSTIGLNFDGFDFSKYFASESEIGLISNIFHFMLKSKPLQHDYDFKLGDFVRWKKEGIWKEARQ